MTYHKNSLILLIALALVFVPVEYRMDGVNVAVNYLFVLIFILISKGNFVKPSAEAAIIYILFSLLLIVGGLNIVLTQINPVELIPRMVLSWALVVLPYTIFINKIKINVRLLKKSLLFVAIIYSLYAIKMIFSDYFFNGIFFPQMIKAGMAEEMPDWPDRFSPILALSGFLLYYDKDCFSKKLKIFGTVLIFSVLMLTFSRAIYISFAIVCFLKIFISIYNKNISIRGVFIGLLLFFVLIISIYSFDSFLEISSHFYDFIYSSFDTFSDSVGDVNSSAGARLDRVDYISTLLVHSPFGFGGLGISNLNSNYGSAESQYIDYLVRFGFPGLVLLFYIQVKAYLKARKISSLSGYAEYILFLMVFGVFHETIRLPYIAISVLILYKIQLQAQDQ